MKIDGLLDEDISPSLPPSLSYLGSKEMVFLQYHDIFPECKRLFYSSATSVTDLAVE
jgi:hypothetical protein